MRRKTKRNFAVTTVLAMGFILFTAIVKLADVRPIGPENSFVGLATLNDVVLHFFGENLMWYTITDWLGVAAILVAFGFAILGLVQWIKRKSLKQVDVSIYVLGVFYVLVVAVYIFFEVFVVNYRPVILYTSLEASYPSSHVMIVVCIMATAMMQFKERIKNIRVLRSATCLSIALIAVTVIGRLISGVHWFTDVIGGLLLSATLVMLYYSVTEAIIKINNRTARESI